MTQPTSTNRQQHAGDGPDGEHNNVSLSHAPLQVAADGPQSPVSGKRARPHNPTSGWSLSTPAKRREGVTPSNYLRSRHPALITQNARSNSESTELFVFERPRDEDLSAYDTAILRAIRSSDVEALRSMRKAGKSMNACNTFGESLLHMACRRSDVNIVRLLVLEFKVRVHVKDDYGRTPLHDACWTTTPNFEIMEILLAASDPRLLLAEDVRGHTPFEYARREHWDAWIQFLEANREKLESIDQETGYTATTG